MLHKCASITLALLALIGPAARAETLQPDMFPDAPRGTLELHMTMSGTGIWRDPNDVEYVKFNASRSADLTMTMVLADEHRGALVPIQGHDLTNLELPEAAQTITNAIEACNGNVACQIEAAQRYANVLEDDPTALGTTMLDDRFDNWVADRSRPCVSGSLSVADSGNGVTIPVPKPAIAFSFSRDGQQSMASAADRLLDDICIAWLSYDTDGGRVSLRLPGARLDVPTQYSGGYSGAETIALIEHADHITILDQQVDWRGGSASGTATVQNAGTASVNDAKVVVPLTVHIAWTFAPDEY